MTTLIDASTDRPPCLLVVDDSATMRQCVHLMLDSILTAPRVLEAAEGAEALKLMEIERPDLLITDLNMDGMDGRALLSSLRQDRRYAQLPVLLMSGDGDDSQDLMSGGDLRLDALNKPFRLLELQSKVLALLKLSPAEKP